MLMFTLYGVKFSWFVRLNPSKNKSSRRVAPSGIALVIRASIEMNGSRLSSDAEIGARLREARYALMICSDWSTLRRPTDESRPDGRSLVTVDRKSVV